MTLVVTPSLNKLFIVTQEENPAPVRALLHSRRENWLGTCAVVRARHGVAGLGEGFSFPFPPTLHSPLSSCSLVSSSSLASPSPKIPSRQRPCDAGPPFIPYRMERWPGWGAGRTLDELMWDPSSYATQAVLAAQRLAVDSRDREGGPRRALAHVLSASAPAPESVPGQPC